MQDVVCHCFNSSTCSFKAYLKANKANIKQITAAHMDKPSTVCEHRASLGDPSRGGCEPALQVPLQSVVPTTWRARPPVSTAPSHYRPRGEMIRGRVAPGRGITGRPEPANHRYSLNACS